MRNQPYTICVRLSEEDHQHYQRLLARFGTGLTHAERFRSMLRKLDRTYETLWDNPGYEELDERLPID